MSESEPITPGTPRYEVIPSRHYAGMSGTFTPDTMPEIAAMWGRFGPQIPTVPNIDGDDSFGMAFDVMSMGDGFEYLAAVAVSTLNGIAAPFRGVTVPERQYAIYQHTAHVSLIGAMCNAIWQQWPSDGGYNPSHQDGAPDLIERYGPGFDPVTGFGDIEIWIPVEAATK